MSIFDEQSTQQANELAFGQEAAAKPTTFTENLVASWQDFRLNDTSNSLTSRTAEAYAERAKVLETLTGEKFDNPYDILPEYGYAVDGMDEAERLAKYEQRVDAVRNRLPPEERAKIASRLSIEDAIRKESQQADERQKDVASRSTAGGVIGSIVGSAGASMTEPLNIVTLPIGAPVRAGLLARIALEAGIAASTEAVLQPGVQSQRRDLGLEYGLGEAATNVGSAAAGAAGLTAGIAGARGALGLIARGGSVALEKALKRPLSADEKALVDAVVYDVEQDRISPYQEQTAAAVAVKAKNDQIGYRAAVEGVPIGQEDLVPADNFTTKMMDTDRTTLEILRGPDLANIGVDAKLMQFKSGGDEQGVTDRLRGVTEWNVERAGVSLIYEFEGGARIIADGHQRLGLARRLSGEGKDVELPAIVLREADGVTPEMARARAAFKNIAEGTGSAQDAAKVLRDMGATPADMGLPPKSALVRDAEGLVNLEEEVFGMVVNRVISEQNGAIIGRLVQDPKLQPSIAGLISKLKPANATEADSIVRQALEAGSTTEKQMGLFGEEEISESLYLERARVLDRGLKMLRRNIDTFRTLNERGTDIVAEGNTLNVDANAARLAIERTLSQYILAQAHRKGLIGDALTQAAKQAKETGQYAPAAREFVEALAGAARRGEINGDAVRASGANSEFEYQAGETSSLIEEGPIEQIDDATIDMFGDPVGKATEEQSLKIAKEIADKSQLPVRGVRSLPSSESLNTPPIPTKEQMDAFSRTETVRLEDLRSTQSKMDWERNDAGDFGETLIDGYGDMPVVGRKENGEYLVFDGHHRAVIALGQGVEEMPMQVIDVKSYAPEAAGRKAAKQNEMSDDDLLAELLDEPKSDGRQMLMDGFEPVNDIDRMMVASTKPLRGGADALDFGIFGSGKDQMDIMDLPVPIGERIDADGNRVAQTMTVREVMDDLEADQEFVEQLGLCDVPRGKAA